MAVMWLSFRKRALVRFFLVCTLTLAKAQDLVIDLYQNVPPYSTGITGEESWEEGRVSKVQIPHLYIFKAIKGRKKRAIVFLFSSPGHRNYSQPL